MAKGIALHIGVNHVDPAHYAGWDGRLNACEADAHSMQQIASAQGFSTRVMLSREAVRPAVLSCMRDAALNLRAGDFFLLTYSGHGGQIPDRNGDETDFSDETWCLFDGQIADDELYASYGQFAAGVRILVLSDSCHSGSVAKAPETTGSILDEPGAPKVMPKDVAQLTYAMHRHMYDRVVQRMSGKDAPNAKGFEPAAIKASVRLLSGCQDDQLSYDGTFNSAFTAALLEAWGNGTFTGNYDAFHQSIASRLTRQTPNHFLCGAPSPAFDAQRPFVV